MKAKAKAPKRVKRSAGAAATVLVLRTCSANLISHGGFQWPESGPVACKDWKAAPHCGNGLHGLRWGEGDGSLLDWTPEAKWQVVEVEESLVVELNGKVKFPRGMVLYCGDRAGAAELLATRAPKGTAIVGGTATAGDGGTATAGDGGTATAGVGGTATAGDGGTATAGHRGTATAGYGGTATAGYGGTATAGDGGTATAGDGGTATAGVGGWIGIEFYDSKRSIWRKRLAEVDGETIKPNVKYRLEGDRFVEVKP